MVRWLVTTHFRPPTLGAGCEVRGAETPNPYTFTPTQPFHPYTFTPFHFWHGHAFGIHLPNPYTYFAAKGNKPTDS
jgi:hypothetical protein